MKNQKSSVIDANQDEDGPRDERRFRIDLREMEGDGEFYCPACGITISPDDYSGLTYSILGVKTKVDGRVEEVVVQCGRCGRLICLDGFDAFQDLGYSDAYFGIEEYQCSGRS